MRSNRWRFLGLAALLGSVLVGLVIALTWTRHAGLTAAVMPRGARDGDPPEAAEVRAVRTPWELSRVKGSPDPPPPYRVEPAFPKRTFNRPVVLSRAPGTDRLFLGEVGGKVVSFPNDPVGDKTDLVLDLAKELPGASALYGIAFHPDFAKNRHVYLCYILGGGPKGSRVSRFEMSRTDPPRIDPRSETLLITWLAGGHNAGCLQFGPDGYLYISTGDSADPSPPDPLLTGQDVTDLLGSILRIDVDHEDPGKPYRVPPDNPLIGVAGARPEIWAYGLRNPWRMSFDQATGDLWVGDVGWELWEMVYRVERGGNYGWSIMEGRQPVRPEGQRGPTPILPPVIDHPHSEAASVTGGYVYRGSRFPDLVGAYIYGDFQTGRVWGLRYDGQKVTWHRELARTPLQLVAFGEDNAGELYLLDYERSNQVYRFAPNPDAGTNRDFPRRLSQTGLFTSVKDQVPAPGVIPYAINAELWSDHARAERFLAVPGSSRIAANEPGPWKFPEGSVLARTVSIDVEPGRSRRLETQILHYERESWHPYTYLWNDEQTDATLADAAGLNIALTIRDAKAQGGRREQTYRIASRAECMLCHNPWAGEGLKFGNQSATPLGMNVEQLNRNRGDGHGGEDQLRTLQDLGLFARPLPASPDDLPKLANPYDTAANLDRRARSYLQVNCAHCHRFGAGGAATIQLTFDTKLKDTRTVGVRPTQGTFGIADARIIAPGDPEGSVLYNRIAKLGNGRMPRAGSRLVDERAVDLIYDWISAMPDPEGKDAHRRPSAEDAAALKTLRAWAEASPESRAAAIRRLTDSTRGALALLRAVDHDGLPDTVRDQVIALTKDHPRVEVRDLFERFVPESDRAQRLGDAIDPAEILMLNGDVARGKQTFLGTSGAQCKNCHRINGTGEELGPDLSKIGAKYQKPALLQHILEPSRLIDPKYTAYLLETTDGRVLSGMLVEKTDREVVLKDAQNQSIRVPAAEVERLVAQPRSLMPQLLLRDMSAQQVADLLEYLASLKE